MLTLLAQAMITVIYQTTKTAKPVTLAMPEGKSLEAIEAAILKRLWPDQKDFNLPDPRWDAMMKARGK